MADLASLLGISPEDISQFVGLLGPSASDQAAANKQGLLAASLGLLGARKGYEMDALRNAGMSGLGAQQGYLTNAAKMRQEALPQISALRQMALQNQMATEMGNILKGAQGQQEAPALPAGSVGGTGMGGGTASLFGPSSQPGAVAGPGQGAPAGMSPNVRMQLAQFNLRQMPVTGKDYAPAIKAMFPDPISLREAGGYLDPMTGKYVALPKPPQGYTYDPESNTFKKVGNAAEAEAASKSVGKAVDLAFEPPTPRVDAQGNEYVPGGTKLNQLFPGGQLPYSAPQPFPRPPQTGKPNGFGQYPGQEANDAAMNAQAFNVPGPGSQPSSITKLGQGATAEQADTGKNTAEYRNGVFAAGDSARTQDATLGEMGQALKNFTPGPTLPTRAAIAGYAQEVPVVGRKLADVLVPNSQSALPSVTAFNKLAVKMTAEQSKVFGSREAQQIVQMVRDAIPNAGMVPGAPETIFRFMNGMNDWAKARQNALVQWENAHNGSAAGFRETWETANPPAHFVPPLEALTKIGGNGQPQNSSGWKIERIN